MTINWAELARQEGIGVRKEPKPKIQVRTKPKPLRELTDRKGDILWADDRKVMFFKDIEYRQIPDHPRYYISKDGVVKNQYGKTLRNVKSSNNGVIRLAIGQSKTVALYRHVLVHSAWEEVAPVQSGISTYINNEEFRVIPSFPDYLISRLGTVVRIKNYRTNTSNKGRIFLSKQGKQYCISRSKLILEAFPGGL